VQAATLNVPMANRMALDNILLVALAKAKVYKKHGLARVISGVDHDGLMHDEPNVADDFRALDVGKWIQIPDDEQGGDLRWWRLRAWVIIFSADYLGAQSMLPFSESPGAYVPCRACDYDTRSAAAARPFSFLRKPSPQTPGGPGRASFAERSWPELKETLSRLRSGVLAQKPTFRAEGLNKLYFALDPEYVLHINPVTIAPQDALHLFPDGLLRSELAWLMYILCKLGLMLSAVDQAVKQCKNMPKDVRIPKFPEKLTKGVAGGRPDSSRTARMTGSQCMHFTLHRCGSCSCFARLRCASAAPVRVSLLLYLPHCTHSVHTLVPSQH
jgi:hypothetical protein